MKKAPIIVVVLLLVAGGIWWFSQSEEGSMPADIVATDREAEMTDNENQTIGDGSLLADPGAGADTAGVGRYEEYSPEKLAMAEDNSVILFFKASWCPSCRALDSDIQESLSDIPSGVVILTVDYDNSNDLKTQYGVTTQHSLVHVDSEGNKITMWSGGSTLESVLAQI